MAWRHARKVFKALLGLLGRAGGILVLTLLMTAVTAALEQDTRTLVPRGSAAAPLVLLGVREPVPTSFIQTRTDWFQHSGNLLLLAGWVFGCVLSTVFLFSLLRHRRWWLLIAGWAAWIAAVQFFIGVALPALSTWSKTGTVGLASNVNTPGIQRGPVASGAVDVLARTTGQVGWVVASAVIMLAVAPAAVLVRDLAASLVRLQRRKLRRSVRRRSQSA